MKAKLQLVSDNDLSELQDLIYRVTKEVESYSHVSNLLPKSLLKSLKKAKTAAIEERDKREEDE